MGFGSILTKHVIPMVEKKVNEHHNNSVKPVENKNSKLPPLEIQIYSHNIRQETNNLMDGERPWKERREGVCGNIYHASQNLPTIVGLQEVKHNQLHDVLYGLGNDWKYFGVGRDDGKTKGEFAPILYQASQWKVINSATYWLSDKTGYPNTGWDGALPRIVTVLTLEHKLGKVLNVFNTHYDHKGKQARINSSKLIMDLMDKIGGVSVLMGDLNSKSTDEAYKTFSNGGLKDSATVCKKRSGFKSTITDFKGKEGDTIDFVWTTSGVEVLNHEVLDHEWKGCYCSDHRPINAIVRI